MTARKTTLPIGTLVENPPAIVVEALATIEASQLYELLRFVTLAAGYENPKPLAEAEVRELKVEIDRWHEVRVRLREAIAYARHGTLRLAELPFARRPRMSGVSVASTWPTLEAVEIDAVTVLEMIAENAERLERDARRMLEGELAPIDRAPEYVESDRHEVGLRFARDEATREEWTDACESRDASLRDLMPDDLEQRWPNNASARAARSPKEIVAADRARAKQLQKLLQWKRPKLAELVLASQDAWVPPPVVLAASLTSPIAAGVMPSDAIAERLRNLIDPRSNRRR